MVTKKNDLRVCFLKSCRLLVQNDGIRHTLMNGENSVQAEIWIVLWREPAG